MPDWLNTLLNLVSQLTGGRGGIDHVIVNYVVAALIWSSLLAVAVARYREDHRSRERILIWGFSLVLGRELFMIFMAGLQAFKLADPVTLHAIFPPLEHALHDLGIITVAGAFMGYLIDAAAPGRRYLLAGIASTVACYLATFWWWADFITANPHSKFGQTWADWLFRINGAVWMLVAAVHLWRRTQGWERNAVCAAMTAFFVSTALKIPDMALGEVYENVFTPIMRLFYLGGSLMLGYVFIREQFQERRAHARSLEEVICNREQLLAELRERKLQLRLFVEHSPAAIAMFNRDMRYLVASRRWLSDYNLGDQTIIGRSDYEVFPDLPERWKEIRWRCLAGAVEKCEEEPFLRADGTTDWVRWEVHPWRKAPNGVAQVSNLPDRGFPIRLRSEADWKSAERQTGSLRSEADWKSAERQTGSLRSEGPGAISPNITTTGSEAQGEIGGLIIFSEVITERKLAEEALRENEQRLRNILDTMFVFVGLMNLDGVIVEVNQAPLEAAGLTRADVLGRTVAESHWFSHSPAVQEQVRRALARAAQGEIMRDDYLIRIAGDQRLTIDTTFAPLRDASGRVTQIVGSAVDITARKQAEVSLRESEEKFGKAFRNSPDAVLLTTLDGHILDANAGFTRLTGWAFEEARGRTTTELRFWADAADRARYLCALREAGRAVEMEAQFRTRAGALRACLISGELMELTGKPAVVGVVRDITERKRAEVALRDLSRRLLQAEDEERRRIAKELHDSTAQDLVAVILNLDMLRDSLPPLDAESARILEDSVALLENSTNDIRTLSYVLHPPRLDEMGLPGGLTEFAAGLGKRADIRIHVEAAPDFGRLPEEFELALFRIAQESLGNVVRHSESDAATIRLTRNDADVVIEIQDFGHGMPPDGTTQPGARGVGIAGMRERVQHLGGRLEIESGSGGTTIRAVLPRKGEPK